MYNNIYHFCRRPARFATVRLSWSVLLNYTSFLVNGHLNSFDILGKFVFHTLMHLMLCCTNLLMKAVLSCVSNVLHFKCKTMMGRNIWLFVIKYFLGKTSKYVHWNIELFKRDQLQKYFCFGLFCLCVQNHFLYKYLKDICEM